MLLIVGLGNPGSKYKNHRHNVGFMALDAISRLYDFPPSRTKFQADISEGHLDGPNGRGKALLIKPQTYMNESGRSVSEAMRFYKLTPADIVVFHDELDLAPGKLRAKIGGGIAGHNGLRSIAAHIGPDFRRIRIGIGHPGHKEKVSGHVLGDFSKADNDWLLETLDAIAKSAPMLTLDDKRFASDVAGHINADTQKARQSKTNQATKRPAPQNKPVQDSQMTENKNAFAEKLKNLFSGKDEN